MAQRINISALAKAARSGSTGGVPSGGNPNGRLVLGKTEELGEMVYKFGKDQANMFLRTTEAIADFVGVKYSREMDILVRYSEEKKFTKPSLPKKVKDEYPPGAMEEYKILMQEYRKELKHYDGDKGRVFGVIMGQCTEVVKNKLEAEKDFVKWRQDADVVSLLEKLKEYAFLAGDHQEPNWALMQAMRSVAGVNQGQTERLVKYYIRFKSLMDVVETQWDGFYPPKLVSGNATKEVIRNKFQACVFLGGLNKAEYGMVLEYLNNQFLSGNDLYPASVDDAYNFVMKFQNHAQGGSNGRSSQEEGVGSSFMQRKRGGTKQSERVVCWKCNQPGHVKSECPELARRPSATSNTQMEMEEIRNLGWAAG